MPALNIFETSYRRGKFDESRKLSDGRMMEFTHIYPMDAVFDTQEDVPEEVRRLHLAALNDCRSHYYTSLFLRQLLHWDKRWG